MEHIRMSGAYWGLTTLDLLGKLHVVDVEEVVSWVIQCQHDSGFYFVYIISPTTLNYCFDLVIWGCRENDVIVVFVQAGLEVALGTTHTYCIR